MSLHSFIDQSYQTFQEQVDDARIILLHPRSRYRSMLIAKLLNEPDIQVYYYAMGPDDINLQAFISSITHDLADQHPTFGRHTNMLPQDVYKHPEDHLDTVLQTFSADLAEITDEPFLLVLDEYDRSDSSDDVQRFVERLSDQLPDNCRLVLNSRTLPRLPWVSMIAHKRAVLLQDDKIIESDFYNFGEHEDNLLEIFALGPGFVLHDSNSIDSWEGHLPRLLFFFALDRPIITRSEICQAFWPDLDSDQAVNVFHVTKRRLHKALDTDVLVHIDGYYQVNPELHIYYDVMEFSSALMRGRNSEDINDKMQAWQRATELYRGPFLQGHNDDWIVERRTEFRAGYMEALTNMANFWIGRDRREQAIALLQKALTEDNTREDIHRQIMQIYNDLGRRGEAIEHYQKLVEAFEAEGYKVEAETHALFESISA